MYSDYLTIRTRQVTIRARPECYLRGVDKCFLVKSIQNLNLLYSNWTVGVGGVFLRVRA